MPIAYTWIFASAASVADTRLNVMAILVTLWGIRLTFNFARKGGYAPGGEDYRWVALRQRMTPWQFQLFNVVFIVGFQSAVVLLMTLPTLAAWNNPYPEFGIPDAVLCAAFVVFLLGETIADEQQWRFQQHKARIVARGEAPHHNFVSTGLFRFSRHPNFFFEQAQWWTFYLFAVISSGEFPGASIIGAALLTMLFVGSSRFTEQLTLKKYPEYRDYQRRTSAIIPWPTQKPVAPTRQDELAR